MRILGIETSCDDTGIAVVEITEKKNPQFSILSNVVSSQIKIHEKYGGVYPMLAKRAHEKNLPITLKEALQKAYISQEKPQIHAIAITIGPGLSPCLWTGINFVKKLEQEWEIPVIPVDHIKAHLLVGLLTNIQDTKYKIPNTKNTFPAIALIVSGGHTQLVLVKKIGDYKIIGETRDDASGEAFDKTARILGLGFPGGPEIAKAASQYNIQDTKYKIRLPRPMIHTRDYDFSFSGLKTAVLYDYQSRTEKVRKTKEYVQEMATEIQQAIVDVLISKTLRAAKEFRVKSIILGGGVAANTELRTVLTNTADAINVNTLIPPAYLATDNGAMIAVAGYFNWLNKKYTKDVEALEAQPNLRIDRNFF